MSKLLRVLAAVAIITGAMAAMPGAAQARWHGGWHGGGWHHGGGWGWGPAFGLGLGLGYGWGYPYYYGGPYYAGPACRWTRVRIWRGDHWALRTVRRCW